MENDTNIHKKYKAYKHKYVKLKNKINNKNNNIEQQTAGASSINIDMASSTFKAYNELKKQNIVLYTRALNLSELNPILHNELNNLLCYDNIKFNLDFLNNFSNHIYVDNTPIDEITVNKELIDGTMVNKIINISRIKRFSGSEESTIKGKILFLTRTQGINKYNFVLKTFSHSFNLTYNASNLQNYTPLEITHISTRVNSMVDSLTNLIKGDYIQLAPFIYNTHFNFNKNEPTIYEDILNIDEILLSVKLSDPVNEFTIAFIIDHIITQYYGLQLDTYVKYYNILTMKMDKFASNYCLIMEQCNGDLTNLFEKLSSDKLYVDSIEFIINTNKELVSDMLYVMLYNIFTTLNLLKQRPFQFCHTDLKAENVYYTTKLVDTISGDIIKFNENYIITYTEFQSSVKIRILNYYIKHDDKYIQIIFKLADFDKSSISFNHVRFYNDCPYVNTQSAAHSFLSKYATVEQTDYFIPFGSADMIEFEQLIMRYTRYPYYMCFDYQSLIFSLLHISYSCNIINHNNKFDCLFPFLNSISSSYKADAIIRHYKATLSEISKQYNGDFGLLIDAIKKYQGGNNDLDKKLSIHTIDKLFDLTNNIYESIYQGDTKKQIIQKSEKKDNKKSRIPEQYIRILDIKKIYIPIVKISFSKLTSTQHKICLTPPFIGKINSETATSSLQRVASFCLSFISSNAFDKTISCDPINTLNFHARLINRNILSAIENTTTDKNITKAIGIITDELKDDDVKEMIQQEIATNYVLIKAGQNSSNINIQYTGNTLETVPSGSFVLTNRYHYTPVGTSYLYEYETLYLVDTTNTNTEIDVSNIHVRECIRILCTILYNYNLEHDTQTKNNKIYLRKFIQLMNKFVFYDESFENRKTDFFESMLVLNS